VPTWRQGAAVVPAASVLEGETRWQNERAVSAILHEITSSTCISGGRGRFASAASTTRLPLSWPRRSRRDQCVRDGLAASSREWRAAREGTGPSASRLRGRLGAEPTQNTKNERRCEGRRHNVWLRLAPQGRRHNLWLCLAPQGEPGGAARALVVSAEQDARAASEDVAEACFCDVPSGPTPRVPPRPRVVVLGGHARLRTVSRGEVRTGACGSDRGMRCRTRRDGPGAASWRCRCRWSHLLPSLSPPGSSAALARGRHR
jgi:hypothetical protein